MKDERGQEAFMARWSRRKREAAAEEDAHAPAPEDGAADPVTPEGLSIVPRSVTRFAAQNDAPTQESKQAFVAQTTKACLVDAGDLPPVDSLGPDSDYTLFLKAGVPVEIKRLGLRRAWLTDPSIAGFRSMGEYDWDFNAPGYGTLAATDDVVALARKVFGGREEPDRRGGEDVAVSCARPSGAEPVGCADPDPVMRARGAGAAPEGSASGSPAAERLADMASPREAAPTEEPAPSRAPADERRPSRTHGRATPV